MAYEVEVTRDRNRLQEAVQGALSGAKQVVGIGADIQAVQQQAESFRQQKLQYEENRQKLLEQQQLVAAGELSKLRTEAFLTDDPEFFIKNRRNDFIRLSKKAGSSETVEDFTMYAKVKSPATKEAASIIKDGIADIYTMSPSTMSYDTYKAGTAKVLSAYNKLIRDPDLSEAQRKIYYDEKEKYLTQVNNIGKSFEEARQKDLNRKTLLEGKKISAAGSGESSTMKAFGRTAGTSLAKRVDALPSQEQRLNDLTNLKRIVRGTAVGPIAGKKISQVIQRLGNADAQRMRIFMNKEQLNTILDFIAVGGGTQIANSNVEREGIINSTVNPESDAEVVIEQINRIEGALREAVERTRAQKKQLAETGNLLGSTPSSTSDSSLDKDAQDLLDLIP